MGSTAQQAQATFILRAMGLYRTVAAVLAKMAVAHKGSLYLQSSKVKECYLNAVALTDK